MRLHAMVSKFFCCVDLGGSQVAVMQKMREEVLKLVAGATI